MNIEQTKKEIIDVSGRYLELYETLLSFEKESTLNEKDKNLLSLLRIFKDNNMSSVKNVKFWVEDIR